MLVANIQGALGNQLFAYAATKSIALDLGLEYRYRVIRLGPPPASPVVDCEGAYFLKSAGHDYNYHFERAFHIDTEERATEIPEHLKEQWVWKRFPETNFNRGVYDITDDSNLCGFFLCPKYFEHRRADVLEWFRFRGSYRVRAEKRIQEIREKNHTTHTVALHIRYAKDIRINGLAIDPGYYIRAVEEMKTMMGREKLCFIVFSDVPRLAAKILRTSRNEFVFQQGSTFDDLCLMTMCDSHIISNSTFSWWGAWLAQDAKGIVIRPSIWPIGPKDLGPEDIFSSSWISVNSKRARLSISDGNRVNDVFRSTLKSKVKQVRRIVKKILKKLLPDLLFKKGA